MLINTISSIEKQNLTMVSQYPENTSGYSNAHYVHEATRFAKRHVDIAYQRVGSDACITVTLRQLSQHKGRFLSQQNDPDGICGGTLTDIQQALVSLDNT